MKKFFQISAILFGLFIAPSVVFAQDGYAKPRPVASANMRKTIRRDKLLSPRPCMRRSTM